MIKFASMLSLIVASLFSVPAIAQDSLSDTVAASAVVMGEPTQQSLGSFRKSLLATAEAAVKAKELSRADLFRLRIASMHKPTLEKMHQACAEQVLADGQAQSYGAIDWTKLLTAFKEFLPILLELIKLFAYVAPSHTSMMCEHSQSLFYLAA